MRRINPIHGLTLLFLIGLILLVLFFREQIPLWQSLLWGYALGAGVLLVLKWCSDREVGGRVGRFINDFSPIFFIILIYQSLGDLTHYLHPDIDPQLIRIDFLLFSVNPTVWMERWIVPWFTSVMSIAYLSYFYLPVRLVHTLYLKNPRRDFDLAVFVLLLGWYLSFAGYILFPAIGPRYTLAHLQSVPLNDSFIGHLVSYLINLVENNKRDCMPSGHTAIALIVLSLSYRYARVLFYLFCPIVGALMLSTVYLRYHYVIDIFAGAALAAGCSIIGPRLYRWWEGGGGQEKREA
jgi:membrane-associated phospholipid phosphatase